ncbi:unnamed protein product [Phytophthora fragariaefolia]|uniref:Unnamed protein product n=1 Tax=Phytophthora fragariaefolia TaxID=1490495 RepID=A0A9W7CUL8_9STRA|nr:unnamed protein product [Phytophthora fragariaefolia]
MEVKTLRLLFLDAIRQLTTRIDAIEKAVIPQRERQGAVSPDLPQRRESIFRQAIDHGSMVQTAERGAAAAIPPAQAPHRAHVLGSLPLPVLRFGTDEFHLHGAAVDGRRGDNVCRAQGGVSNDHFLYLIALMHATDASPAMLLQNIVRHASPRFSPTRLGRYDEQRQDYLLHAQELVQFAQRFDVGGIDRRTADKDVVNAVEDTRKCYNCSEMGHIALMYPQPKRVNATKAGGATKPNWTLVATVSDQGDGDQRWIVYSGASRHLVNNSSLLCDAKDCVGALSLTLPDGATLPVTLWALCSFKEESMARTLPSL